MGLSFSSKLDWDSYIVSITKSTSEKIGALVHFMKFLSLEVALYLHKCTTRLCVEYCCKVLTGAPDCCLELLGKLQKQLYRTVGPSPAVFLKTWSNRSNVASLRTYIFLAGWKLKNLTSSFPNLTAKEQCKLLICFY